MNMVNYEGTPLYYADEMIRGAYPAAAAPEPAV